MPNEVDPSPVLTVQPLTMPWPTLDPFLFCVFHQDAYPEGDEQMGPRASLVGRSLGQDFGGRDGWSMYHGRKVPGFPQHPHRGFETVTVVREGLIDHFDSMGATGRLGAGDVQWMTAGRGVLHSEMFPLVRQDARNPTELFQLWLNLPAASKMAEPHFSMFWSEGVPRRTFTDGEGRSSRLTIVAGEFDGTTAPSPPPSSFASDAQANVAIWLLSMDPFATLTLPPAGPATNRVAYLYEGDDLRFGGDAVERGHAAALRSTSPVVLKNGAATASFLILQGRPIGEPVAQHGPFVMNTRAELVQAFEDYQRTQFGGWPWPSDAPVHSREQGRFARHADGREERPE